MQIFRRYTFACSGFALIALCAVPASAGDFFNLCKHFELSKPPRGEMAIAMPGRLSMESSPRKEMEAATKDLNQKMSDLEKDVSELARLVKAMVAEEAKQQEDTAQLSRLVKSMVGVQSKQRKDMEELSRLVKGLVEEAAK